MALHDTVHHVRKLRIAFESLSLGMKTDEDEESRSQKFRDKQNAIRKTSLQYRLNIRNCLESMKRLRISRDLSQQLRTNTGKKYRSPLDLVEILNAYNNVTTTMIENLLKNQYEIKWQTETGDPEPFSFYKFCAKLKNVDVMTYGTRRAHVISRLYQKQAELREIRGLTHRELCPPIYVRRTDKNWFKFTSIYDGTNNSWSWITENLEENGTDWITNFFLKTHIDVFSKKYDEDAIRNRQFLGGKSLPGQLYWAVFEENDRKTRKDLPPIKTQVYVGKATNGIKERWLGGGTSHCKRMEILRDVMCGMLSYDPTTLVEEQLVDLRFLLHKACNQDGSNSGLFVMETYEIELKQAEKQSISGYWVLSDDLKVPVSFSGWKPIDMNYGLNGR